VGRPEVVGAFPKTRHLTLSDEVREVGVNSSRWGVCRQSDTDSRTSKMASCG